MSQDNLASRLEEAEEEEAGKGRELNKYWAWIVSATALLYGLYQFFIIYNPPTTIQLRVTHLVFALVLIFAIFPSKRNLQTKRSVPWYDLIFILASLSFGLYIAIESRALSMERLGFYNTQDIAVSIVLVILVIEATRRVLGLVLPIIALVFLMYAYFGYLIPGPLGTRDYDISRIATHLSMWTEGIMGTAIGATANFVMLFVIFAVFLQKSGVGQFFIDVAMGVFGRFRGGPAKVSVVASSLLGTVSGSAVANVAGTGTLTIPMMRKSGFKKEEAGAVEAVSSSGGQLVPPLMGAGAFVMADIIGVPYLEIVVAAIIPAILYYVSVFISVDVIAAQKNIKQVESNVDVRIGKTLIQGWHLTLPLVVLVMLMTVGGASPGRAVFWATVACVVVSWLRSETRMGPRQIIEAIIAGSKAALSVVAVCACAGIIIGVFSLTGLGLSLSGILVSTAGESLWVLLLLTMVACLVAGMGLPTVAAYIVVAVLVAPALTSLGVPVIQAHLFVFYFAILSAITPPVALASYVAAGIAKGSPMRTSLVGLKMVVGGLIVPFLFVTNSELVGEGSLVSVISAVVSAIVGIIFVTMSVQGFAYYLGNLGILLRVLSGAIGLALLIPHEITNWLGVAAAFGGFMIWMFGLLSKSRKTK